MKTRHDVENAMFIFGIIATTVLMVLVVKLCYLIGENLAFIF